MSEGSLQSGGPPLFDTDSMSLPVYDPTTIEFKSEGTKRECL